MYGSITGTHHDKWKKSETNKLDIHNVVYSSFFFLMVVVGEKKATNRATLFGMKPPEPKRAHPAVRENYIELA